MNQGEHLGRWRSPAAEARFRTMEDELWPDAPDAIDVDTHLGQTRVYRWTGEGTPVLLLHGQGGTALSWSPLLPALGERPVLGVDTIGDVGRSVQRAPVRDAEDLERWLVELLDGLDVDAAHTVGTSYGGFLALRLAAAAPERVRSLALLDPGGLAEVQLARFIRWGMKVFSAAMLPGPLRRRAARRLRMPALEDPRLLRMARHGQFNHSTKLPRPDPLGDAQLRSILVPALVLVPARSEAFDPDEAARRAALLPHGRVEVVPDAGHALQLSHADLVADRLGQFLDGSEIEPMG